MLISLGCFSIDAVMLSRFSFFKGNLPPPVLGLAVVEPVVLDFILNYILSKSL